MSNTVTSPWTTNDHDPISAQYTSPETTSWLEEARTDIAAAHAAIDDPHRRRQYALSARDNAVSVLLAGDAAPDQIRDADHYLAQAEAFIATA
ncbi:hypothetical protein [Mycolicibacterium peregrinum]|uniref:hypothetical protein n=1 Tax=Mycolicibacterium peregrinum TaxID=43304 RepID=UPI003AAB2EE1